MTSARTTPASVRATPSVMQHERGAAPHGSARRSDGGRLPVANGRRLSDARAGRLRDSIVGEDQARVGGAGSMRLPGDPEAVALAAITRAASAGLPCPSNGELADLVGAGSVATGTRLLSLLERRGLIRVTRFASGREVTVLASGQSTARVAGSRRPHFSYQGARDAARTSPAKSRTVKAATPYSKSAAALDAAPRARLPDSPCFRCGARGWCGHNGRVAA